MKQGTMAMVWAAVVAVSIVPADVASAQCNGSLSMQEVGREYDNTCTPISVTAAYSFTGSMQCNQPGFNIEKRNGEASATLFVQATGVCRSSGPVFPYYWCNPGPPGSNSTYINSDGVQEARAEYQDASWDAQSQKCTWTEYLEEKLTNEGIGACNAGPCCEGRSMCENNGDRWFDSSCMCAPSPLYLLFDGPWSSALTSAEDGVPFVMRPGTPLNMVGWTKANSRSSGLLVRDRDGNGRIDSGAELYGGATPQPTPPGQPRHGFTALGPEDADGNGWIDKHDPAYELMAVWFDINHNGVSDTGELVGLAAAGIKTLGVSYQTFERTDSNGNTFAFVSDMIVRKKGREYRGTVYDVYPSMAPIQEPRLARH